MSIEQNLHCIYGRKHKPVIALQFCEGSLQRDVVINWLDLNHREKNRFKACISQLFRKVIGLRARAGDQNALHFTPLVPRTSSARCEIACCASSFPSCNGSLSSPVTLMAFLPSSEMTNPVSPIPVISDFTMVSAYAATGTAQPPPSPLRKARSAVTALRVDSSSKTDSKPSVVSSSARHWIASAPCPGAGSITSKGSHSVTC